MKKKIAADLTSLAHRILQMKNKGDVNELQAIAKELYEKLTVLVSQKNILLTFNLLLVMPK
jgi:hypothetical protein